VIKEALRIHTAPGFPLGRVVPKQGATIAGEYFASGMEVGVNPWVVHFNKELFGDDAEDFRPERWLEDPGRAAEMGRYLLTVSLHPMIS
jgi:cytochrome P450